jgi:hypothetical protein
LKQLSDVCFGFPECRWEINLPESPPKPARQHETKTNRAVTTICDGVAKTPEGINIRLTTLKNPPRRNALMTGAKTGAFRTGKALFRYSFWDGRLGQQELNPTNTTDPGHAGVI